MDFNASSNREINYSRINILTFAQTTHLALPPPKLSCGVGPERSQPCQVATNMVKGFRLPVGSKSAYFLQLVIWLIQQVRDTAQPVITAKVYKSL